MYVSDDQSHHEHCPTHNTTDPTEARDANQHATDRKLVAGRTSSPSSLVMGIYSACDRKDRQKLLLTSSTVFTALCLVMVIAVLATCRNAAVPTDGRYLYPRLYSSGPPFLAASVGASASSRTSSPGTSRSHEGGTSRSRGLALQLRGAAWLQATTSKTKRPARA